MPRASVVVKHYLAAFFLLLGVWFAARGVAEYYRLLLQPRWLPLPVLPVASVLLGTLATVFGRRNARAVVIVMCLQIAALVLVTVGIERFGPGIAECSGFKINICPPSLAVWLLPPAVGLGLAALIFRTRPSMPASDELPGGQPSPAPANEA